VSHSASHTRSADALQVRSIAFPPMTARLGRSGQAVSGTLRRDGVLLRRVAPAATDIPPVATKALAPTAAIAVRSVHFFIT
jgi:hypothetical protein